MVRSGQWSERVLVEYSGCNCSDGKPSAFLRGAGVRQAARISATSAMTSSDERIPKMVLCLLPQKRLRDCLNGSHQNLMKNDPSRAASLETKVRNVTFSQYRLPKFATNVTKLRLSSK